MAIVVNTVKERQRDVFPDAESLADREDPRQDQRISGRVAEGRLAGIRHIALPVQEIVPDRPVESNKVMIVIIAKPLGEGRPEREMQRDRDNGYQEDRRNRPGFHDVTQGCSPSPEPGEEANIDQ